VCGYVHAQCARVTKHCHWFRLTGLLRNAALRAAMALLYDRPVRQQMRLLHTPLGFTFLVPADPGGPGHIPDQQ